jgi:GNAT superfamily N-acetyltransferase
VIVRPATEADLPGFLEGAKEFISESAYGWTYSEEIATHTFRVRLAHPDAAILVAWEGEICGASIVLHDRDYCLERIGYVEKFYVRPKYRGTPCGRMLVEASLKWFEDSLCWAAFVTATANIGAAQDKQFANLFKKYGFVDCGPTLMRDFADG